MDRPTSITRRGALALGAVVGAGVLVRPVVPLAGARTAATDPTDSFALGLPAGALERGVTPVLAAPQPFDLLGVAGEGLGHAQLAVRVRRGSGPWSRWTTLHASADHAPDNAGRSTATDPVWTGRADQLQLRAATGAALGPLKVHFVSVDRDAAHGARAARAAGAHAAAVTTVVGGAPAMVLRHDWGADALAPRNAPSYGRIDMAFVHHTETANDYSAEESPGIVMAIYRYHRNTNGWSDIGYNFLVDKYGTIFEGRLGGIDKAVIGAQAQGYNSFSTGVSCIGSFMGTPLPDPALDAVCRLIAWKLPLHGAPVTGELVVVSGGGTLNAHPYGAQVNMHRIAGHRDGDATDCPGDVLYGQLPAIRDRTAQYAGQTAVQSTTPRLSLSGPTAAVAYGAPAALRGTLVDGAGAPLAGVGVSLQKQGPSGKWSRLAAAVTGSDGTWSGSVAWKAAGKIRGVAVVNGATAISPALLVGLVPQLTAGKLPATVRVGTAFAVTGTVRPTGSVKVVLERRQASGKWVVAGTQTIKATKKGSVRASLALAHVARYRVRLQAGSASTPSVGLRAINKSTKTGGATAR